MNPSGYAPEVTIRNSKIEGVQFSFKGSSNITVSNSVLMQMAIYGLDNSKIWLVNSTHYYGTCLLSGSDSKQYVCWYLDVHVVDSLGQDVPSANVTATYPNATLAELKLTDLQGWTRLILIEKMMNVTGEYPIGEYTIEATYESYLADISVTMTDNRQITLTLQDFVIPEFLSQIVMPLFMIVTLLLVIAYRKMLHS